MADEDVRAGVDAPGNIGISLERLHELVYQAAGAATGVLLQDHPQYVFPSERVSAAVARVLDEFDIPMVGGYSREYEESPTKPTFSQPATMQPRIDALTEQMETAARERQGQDVPQTTQYDEESE